MGHLIEVAQKAVRVTATSGKSLYILNTLAGNSRVIDNETGKFSRSWATVALGNAETIKSKIGELAKSAGNLSIRSWRGRNFTESSYKTRCIKTLINATELRAAMEASPHFDSLFGLMQVVVSLNELESNPDSRQMFIELAIAHLDSEDCNKLQYAIDDTGIETDVMLTLSMHKQQHIDLLVAMTEIASEEMSWTAYLKAPVDDQDHAIFEAIKGVRDSGLSTH